MLGVPVHVNIEEVRKPETDAQLIADSIAQQLAKRIMFRRAMKRAITNAMRLGAQGIKIMSAGRLNGIEIARTEWYREGRVPLHTMRAEIDYGVSEAKTSYGVIGIKVWVFKGEVLHKSEQPMAAVAAALAAPAKEADAPAPSSDAPGAKPKKPRAPRKPGAKPGPRSGAKSAATRKA
jgi:small subunit ribosomal protein S3